MNRSRLDAESAASSLGGGVPSGRPQAVYRFLYESPVADARSSGAGTCPGVDAGRSWSTRQVQRIAFAAIAQALLTSLTTVCTVNDTETPRVDALRARS